MVVAHTLVDASSTGHPTFCRTKVGCTDDLCRTEYIMCKVFDDDWRLRPLVWYDSWAEVEDAWIEVLGEQEEQ